VAGALQPKPPPPLEASSPFTAEQLVHLGNALSQLCGNYPPRFLEIYQEQLSLAIPCLSQEECELVSPTLAMSQLMHDPLRRAFLERCAQIEAGKPAFLERLEEGAAPDISTYHKQVASQRRRSKYFRNVYIIEASIRKDTFSFFASLPADVRAYLDRLHADACQLSHEGVSSFTSQVAAVLDQLGVVCDTGRMCGPICLHVVSKSTNPHADCDEVVYECSDTSSFYSLPQDDRSKPRQLTATSKMRHRLLQRLGVQLRHISIWEWQDMTEAQRINYMVKLQSLQ